MKSRLHMPAMLGGLMLLAGCAAPNPNLCPGAAILADTDHATMLRPGAPADPSGALYRVALTNTATDCHLDKRKGETDSTLTLTFTAQRAPGADGATYSVPYFVAVTENAKIYNKRLLYLKFTFAPGASTATINQSPNDFQLHVSNGKLPWNYEELAGFQMSPDQIAYAKNRSRYVP